MSTVVVRRAVMDDVRAAVSNSRTLLNQVLFDLQNDLPRNLAQYQANRCLPNNPSCFWYERFYSLDMHSFQLRNFRFVIRDSDPSMLDVIWVVVVS